MKIKYACGSRLFIKYPLKDITLPKNIIYTIVADTLVLHSRTVDMLDYHTANTFTYNTILYYNLSINRMNILNLYFSEIYQILKLYA